jgi:hypothetical protein
MEFGCGSGTGIGTTTKILCKETEIFCKKYLQRVFAFGYLGSVLGRQAAT